VTQLAMQQSTKAGINRFLKKIYLLAMLTIAKAEAALPLLYLD